MIVILYTLAGLLFLRSALFALGKKTVRIGKIDTLENQQKLTGIVLIALCVISAIYKSSIFFYIGVFDFLLTFLFYLQPTARTTKSILKVFLLVNIVALAVIIYRYFR